MLERSPFPGNVRELRSLAASLVASYDGGLLRPSHLPASLLTSLPSDAADWERDLGACIEAVVQAGVPLEALVEKTKGLACQAALKLEGSARRAALRIGVSTRMVEKRRVASGANENDRGCA